MGKRRRLPLRQPGTGAIGRASARVAIAPARVDGPKGPKTMNYQIESGPNYGEGQMPGSERFDSNEETTSGAVNA